MKMDDIYNALVIEQGVITTDYSHVFKANKVSDKMSGSPYQALHNESDLIGINDGKFAFLDGKTVADCE